MEVTVFTPLYNREKSIRAVYDSLCAQTNKKFEWLVLNDGSTDSSGSIMRDIVSHHDGSFSIRYYEKENEGLNRTINRALDLAHGDMFLRIDSDDTALPEAVELVHKYYPQIADRKDLCAIAFYAVDSSGKMVGWHPFTEVRICNFPIFRDKYHARGDRSEVMKTAVYKKFKFPEFPNEKFCPEGLVWNRISRQYDALYIPAAIYRKGSPDDSITADVYHHLKKSCVGTCTYYLEIMKDNRLSYRYRLINAIKYYRYALFAKFPLVKGIPLNLLFFAFPIGMLVVLRDKFFY